MSPAIPLKVGSRVRVFPNTLAEWLSGISDVPAPDSIWPCQDAAVPAADVLTAAKDLVNPGGTVTFNVAQATSGEFYDRKSISLVNISSRLRNTNTATYDATTNSFSGFFRFKFNATPGNGHRFLRKKSSSANLAGYICGTNASGHVTASVSSGADKSCTVAVSHDDGSFHDVLFSYNAASPFELNLYTDLGSASVDTSAVGNMTNALFFGIGDTQGNGNAAARAYYSYMAFWGSTALTSDHFRHIRGLD